MEYQEEAYDYSFVIDNITNMFGNIINKDVITTIVESCGGDLNLSVDAIMNITSDSNNVSDSIDKNSSNPNQDSASNIVAGTSYSVMAEKSSNIVKELSQMKPIIHSQAINNVPNQNRSYFWTDKVSKIIEQHKKCTKIMVIMRGAPGSGKTSLARQIVDETVGSNYSNYNTHIFSADDYFIVRGKYVFNRYKLSEAHSWNQERVKVATRKGLSPIIVDNTNIELWEMEPYVRDGVKQGYVIEVLEPTTPWAWNIYELSRRNIHNVTKPTISRMLENYCHNITGEMLLKKFGLFYPVDRVPAIYQALPVLPSEVTINSTEYEISKPLEQTSLNNVQDESEIRTIKQIIPKLVETAEIISEPGCSKDENTMIQTNNTEELSVVNPVISEDIILVDTEQADNIEEDNILSYKYMKAQEQLDKLQKEELEWESNESWSINNKKDETDSIENATTSVVKPKRSRRTIDKEALLTEHFKDTVIESKDWSRISMFMAPWNRPDKTEESNNHPELIKSVEKVSCGTCVEISDMDPLTNFKKYKVISASPRNINEFYIPFNKEKIPHKIMLDKSSMTNEYIFKETVRCPYEEKHFSSFKKLFPKVATADLRDIFDKCCGNVNWAVEIVFDSVANKLLHMVENDDSSDIEEDTVEQCQCLAAYNIIPDTHEINPPKTDTDSTDILNAPGCSKDIVTPSKKKIKKGVSDSSMLLKSQIEQNVVISDSYYSDHCLKIKKMRHGDNVKDNRDNGNDGDNGDSLKVEDTSDQCVSSDNLEPVTVTETQEDSESEQSDDEESNFSINEFEKVVPVTVGMDFVKVLDALFDRDIIYPPNIKPRLNLRLSLLNELNAVWMESLMHQFEDQARNATKRDEEFARELAEKEAEILQAGKEPAVPDFKEIMDMELALNLYKKDVEEWKNQQPADLAAKLSRDKLFDLFPDVSQDTLLEVLMAHDNNFQDTVEVLLNSTGETEIVNKPDGVKKFIMKKEMERQQKILEQERKALSEVEWPLLTKGEVIEMSTVNDYREKAEKHLQRTNTHFNKAQEYEHRGMSNVAAFYAQMSFYHRQKYEYANSMAAVSLIQMNTAKNPNAATIDLHYLHVPEARESLDIFIDFHIQKLKESHSRGGPRVNTLFLITGRGLHSPGGPRIKPAVIRRLRERKLGYRERNPGLLSTKISADDALSHELK